MNSNAIHRIALGVTPAVVMVGVLASCSPSAPSAKAPPATAKSTAATGAPTETGVPTVSDAPSSASTPDPAKVCDSTADDDSTPAKGGFHTKKVAWGKPLAFARDHQGKVAIAAARPTTKKTAKNDVFGPKPGQIYLLIKVTVRYKSGKASTVNDVFVLKDAKKNLCETASPAQDVVPTQQVFASGTVSKKTPTYTGTVIFAVPKDQDYTKYTLRYLVDDYDPSTPDTVFAWTK